MTKRRSFILTLLFLSVASALARAADLDIDLDRYETSIPMTAPTVFSATLHNPGKSRLYITGIRASLSENAVADVYNPVLLHEQLNHLDAGQTWDGPLFVVVPKRRGPLWISGSILIDGGVLQASTATLAVIPLHLTIDDPKRKIDGSINRGILPVCDRPADRCCDPAETGCFQMAGRCVYIADGFNHQQVCIDGQSQALYDHVADLSVSSGAFHVAYIAGLHCSTGSLEERCERVVVLDGVEHRGADIPTNLELSPDGQHYAYTGRTSCVARAGQEVCTGPRQAVLDGRPEKAWPEWYVHP